MAKLSKLRSLYYGLIANARRAHQKLVKLFGDKTIAEKEMQRYVCLVGWKAEMGGFF